MRSVSFAVLAILAAVGGVATWSQAGASRADSELPPYGGEAVDFSFCGAKNGFLLLSSLDVLATTDGGMRWRAVGRIEPVLSSGGDGRPVSRLHFADAKNGWAFGPSLFVTHDGGKTWKQELRESAVIALASGGLNVWAVERTAEHERVTVLTSPIGESRWRPMPTQPDMYPIQESSGLVRDGEERGWLLAHIHEVLQDRETEDPRKRFAETQDGGRSWRQGNPCEKFSLFPSALSVSPDGTVWLVCTGQDVVGDPRFFLKRDSDGLWQATTTTAATYGRGLGSFAAASSKDLWITENRSAVRYSGDGGRTWKPKFLEYEFDGFGSIAFADARHGWLLYRGPGPAGGAYYNWIFRTADGGRSWKRFKVTAL